MLVLILLSVNSDSHIPQFDSHSIIIDSIIESKFKSALESGINNDAMRIKRKNPL